MKNYINTTKPTCTKDIIGNQKIIQKLKNDINLLNSKSILISGPIGIGKTLSINLIIKELNLQPIWIDIYDYPKNININLLSINMKKRIIIFDNIEKLNSSITKNLIHKFKITQCPIVIICNDFNVYSLKTIEKYCEHYKFIRPSKIEIRKFLLSSGIFKENSNINKIEELISNCQNDVRYILNMISMKIINASKNNDLSNDNINIFDSAKILFNKKLSTKTRLDSYYFDKYFISMFVFQNTLKSSYLSKDLLSQSDIYSTILKGLSKYQGILLIYSINLYKEKSMLQFPILVGKESAMKSRYNQFLLFKGQHFRTRIMGILYPKIIEYLNNNKFDKLYKILSTYNISKDQIYDLLEPCWLGPKLKINTTSKTSFTKYYKLK